MRCQSCQRDVRQIHRGMCSACYRTWRKENAAPNAKCENCGRPFFSASPRRHVLCSRECFRFWKVARSADNEIIPNRVRPPINAEGGVRLICEYCEISFAVFPYELGRQPRFCSTKCSAARRAVPRTILSCDHCGGIFRYLPNRLLLVPGRYCSRVCFEEARRINRLSREGDRGRAYRQFRERLVEQAGSCRLCGNHADLVLHHRTRSRERPDLMFAPDNVEVLCRACHTRVHAKQGHYRLPEVAA